MEKNYSGSCFILAKVVDVGDGNYLYHCCSSCFSRMLNDGNRWLCMKCHKTSDLADFRYRVTFLICDGPQVADITVFGALLDPYFGCSASEFSRHLEKSSKDKIQTAVIDTFIGKNFWFGFPKPVSRGGDSVQFHYLFEPIVHQLSCSSSLIPRHMILSSFDQDNFISVIDGLRLDDCPRISHDDMQVDCDVVFTPLHIDSPVETSDYASHTVKLTFPGRHQERCSKPFCDSPEVSVSKAGLVESFSRQLRFETGEINFNQSSGNPEPAETLCLSSDDLFIDSSVLDRHVDLSIDDLFSVDSSLATELEDSTSQRYNANCIRKFSNFSGYFQSKTEQISSRDSVFPDVSLMQIPSQKIEFAQLLDTYEDCPDVDADLDCSGDIFDSSCTLDQSLICSSTPL